MRWKHPTDLKVGDALTTCLDYALSHNVEHLSIDTGDLDDYPCKISFACLKTLHLRRCQNLPMMDYWTMPSLTSFYLEVVSIGNQILGFENLKELTLVENCTGRFHAETITINCLKLQSLTLNPVDRHTFIVSAPSLYYLSYCSRHVSALFARDGFPCKTQVYIDIRKNNGEFFKCYIDRPYLTLLKLVIQNFILMLKAASETPFLELSSETIEGLQMIYSQLSKYEHSSLGNLKILSLRGPGLFDMQPPRTNYVIDDIRNYVDF
ncbi:hypothetical protein POM88_003013 [Heracleum sosnowskyi]|uniref:Uncharacterized protein n=1 Tax=Heracleum sosnowskyi TaxID=360622 RepID=A0AAD8JHT6_9APIA|nr:hypothetical protein POM88_003013 [Heracleum sosnowskyi]